MSEKPLSPLRRRMIKGMSLGRFTPDPQRESIRAVKRLTVFRGRSPDTATSSLRGRACGTYLLRWRSRRVSGQE